MTAARRPSPLHPLPATAAMLAITIAGCSPTAIILGAVIAASGGGGGGNGGPTTLSAVVDSSGGTLRHANGAEVSVPPGALSAPTTLTIGPGTETTSGTVLTPIGAPAAMGPSGLQFASDVTLLIPFTASALPPGTLDQDLFVLKRDDASGALTELVPVAVDRTNGFLTVTTRSFSTFQAVLGQRADPDLSTIEADRTSGVIADGVDRATITVRLRDALGRPVPGHQVVLGATGAANTLAQPTGPTGPDGSTTGAVASTRAEVKTITASVNPGGLHSVTLNATVSVEFIAGPPARLAFGTQPSNALAGAPIVPTVTVDIQDAGGNRTASTAAIALTLQANAAGAVLVGTTSVAGVSGAAAFADVRVDRAASGLRILASSGGLAGATSDPFDVGTQPPVIAVSMTTLPFGTVTIGQTADLPFTVSNTGGATLSGVATTSAPFTIVSSGSYNLTGGQSQVVTVRFAPTAAGAANGSVTLTGGGGASVALSGTGELAPAISVTPAALAFGTVTVGQTADLPFTVSNTGGATLVGTATTSAPFSITGAASYSLTAGQSQVVTVRFAPIAVGAANGSVTLTGGGGASVGLSATGAASSTNNPPMATLDPLPNVVGGDVTVRYHLLDADWDSLSVDVEYSTDGVTFTAAVERAGLPSEGTTSLSSSFVGSGAPHVFVWDTVSSLGQGEHSFVVIRVRPSDVTTGAEALSAAFRVDNVRPRLERARYVDDNGTRAVDEGDVVLVTFSEPVRVGSISANGFHLPVSGDSLGSGVVVSPTAEPQTLQIRLATGTALTTVGTFSPTTTAPGSASGLDVAVGVLASALSDMAGNAPVDLGTAGVNGDGVDIEELRTLHLEAQRPILLHRSDLVEVHAASGDLDGDGVADVVLGSPGLNPISGLGQWTNAVVTVRGLSTGGSFDGRLGAVSEISAGLGPGPVALADYSGDGQLDAAFAEQKSPSVLVMRGSGDLSLTATRRLAVAMTPTAIAAADLNGDGVEDLVVGGTADQVAVLRGRGAAGVGSGDFDPATFAPCPGLVASLMVADTDNDGIPDIVVAAGARVSILRGVGTNGRGTATFDAPTSVTFGGTVSGVAVGDVDRDGWVDIAAGVGSSIALLRNSTGSFSGISGTLGTGSVAGCPVLADFNGDGLLDVVVPVGSELREYRGRNSAVLGAGSFDVARPVVVGGVPAPIIGLVPIPGSDPRVRWLIAVRRDLATSVSSLVLIPGGRDGLLVSQPASAQPGAQFAGRLAIAEFNGDGIPDAVMSTGGTTNLQLLMGRGNGGVGTGAFTASSLGVGSSPLDVAVADLNSDGITDIVAPEFNASEVIVLMGNGSGGVGNGTFTVSSSIVSVSSQPCCIATGMIDGGSHPDVVVAHQTGMFTVLRGLGDGSFTTSATPLGGGFARFTLADVDGDTKRDIVSPRDTLQTLLGAGDGTFAARETHGTAGGFGIVLGDFDHDGRPDAALGTQSLNGRISVSLNRSTPGAVSFAAEALLPLSDASISESLRPDNLAVADFDGDGSVDIASTLGRAAGETLVSVHLGLPAPGPNGERFIIPAHLFLAAGSDANGGPVAIVDSNKDGRPDLLVATNGGHVFIRNGLPPGSGPPLPAISVTPTALAFGTVTVSQTADLTFTVSNVGVGIVSGTATTSAPFSITGAASYSLTAGQSQVITVRFSPTSTTTTSGSVVLTGGGGASVTLSGTGAAAQPAISVAPGTLAFGPTPVGTTRDLAFTVTNSGTGMLSGSASVAAPFSIVSGGSYSLSGGQSQVVTARFAPLAAGTVTANITCSGADEATVGVSGLGHEPAVFGTARYGIDRFTKQ